MGDWTQIIGVSGTDPEVRDVSIKGEPGTVTKFRMVAPTGAPVKTESGWQNTDTWFTVSVFNEGLQAVIKEEVYKGAKVAVEGNLTVRPYEGKDYYEIVASGVYLTQRLGGAKTAASRPLAAAAAAAEDLGF